VKYTESTSATATWISILERAKMFCNFDYL
jgi:hypothetical protein